ncbi:DNA-3-methyladenine glycosylase family protein [Evansella tamaricis]|uniref:DNA-3-methyladenine glycosylase II n=1 Tax=Evansella tamaricis TaxID=2069301 RepID=A0ABS6JHI8_9BACI|nr:DNA-3-methyladenine glycosylase [Evansella tamaricis]MBU9712860.1 DNA-3-methyladenine glycosylase [Evansella tamaricis]
MVEQVVIQGPYNFFQALKRLTIDPLNDIDLKKQSVKIPIQIGETMAAVEVKQTGSFEFPCFQVSVSEGRLDWDLLLERLTDIFHWDTPLQKINDHFKGTELEPLFDNYRGTPFVCDFNLYGSLMKTIIHQQLNLTFAYRLTERFVKKFGMEKDGAWFYPEPDVISNLKVEDLRELQFSQRKSEYVIDTSRLIKDGLLDLHSLKDVANEDVVKQLTAIRGVGRWTAECFLMFGLGRLDLFPVQDIGIQNGLKHFFQMDRKPTLEEMHHWSEMWKPYRTYASLYLWESLETD